jgi:hypothetical protein
MSTLLLNVSAGHPMTKKGAWFIVAHRFTCEACKREVPITYSHKIALFNRQRTSRGQSRGPALADCAEVLLT